MNGSTQVTPRSGRLIASKAIATDNTSLWMLRGLEAKVLRKYTSNGTWSVAENYIYRNGLLLAAETPSSMRHLTLTISEPRVSFPRVVMNG